VYAPWNENPFTETKRAKRETDVHILNEKFVFDSAARSYRCPEGKFLRYRERSQQQRANGDYFTIEIYQADPSDCAECPLKRSCLRRGSNARTVRRREHEELIGETAA
jgi:hypothetical protein